MRHGLDVTVDRSGHHALLHVAGLLDAYTGDHLRAVIAEQIESGVTHVELDASAITFVDSGGLGVLNDTQSDLEQRGGGLVIIDLSGAMAQILRLTDLTDRFGL